MSYFLWTVWLKNEKGFCFLSSSSHTLQGLVQEGMWQWPISMSYLSWTWLALGLQGPGKSSWAFPWEIVVLVRKYGNILHRPFLRCHLWAFLTGLYSVKLFKLTYFHFTVSRHYDSFSFQFIFLFGLLSCCFSCTRTGCTLYWLSCLVFSFSDILHLNVYLICWISCVLKHSRVQLLFCFSCIFSLIPFCFFACSAGPYFSQVILGVQGLRCQFHFWLGNILYKVSSSHSWLQLYILGVKCLFKEKKYLFAAFNLVSGILREFPTWKLNVSNWEHNLKPWGCVCVCSV